MNNQLDKLYHSGKAYCLYTSRHRTFAEGDRLYKGITKEIGNASYFVGNDYFVVIGMIPTLITFNKKNGFENIK